MNVQQVVFASLTCAASSSLACGVSDEPTASAEADLDDVAQFRRGHRHHSDGGSGGTTSGSTGGSSGGGTGVGGGDVGCDVCMKANACCNAVGGGALCTFSSATCSALGASAQAPYVNACRTLLTTTFRAWNSKPPAQCL